MVQFTRLTLEKMKYEVEGHELAFRYEMLLNELDVLGSDEHVHAHTQFSSKKSP